MKIRKSKSNNTRTEICVSLQGTLGKMIPVLSECPISVGLVFAHKLSKIIILVKFITKCDASYYKLKFDRLYVVTKCDSYFITSVVTKCVRYDKKVQRDYYKVRWIFTKCDDY